jgi:putative oxidoreductase
MAGSTVGRILLGILFLGMGILKWLDFKGTVSYFTFLGFPIPAVFVVLAIIILTLCGLGLIFNVGTAVAATMLVSYLIIALAMAHNIFVAFNKPTLVTFLQVLGLIGGLLYVIKASTQGEETEDDTYKLDVHTSKKSDKQSKKEVDSQEEAKEESKDKTSNDKNVDDADDQTDTKQKENKHAEKSEKQTKSVEKVVTKTIKPKAVAPSKTLRVKSVKKKSNSDLPSEI